jgi:LysM repeat protein
MIRVPSSTGLGFIAQAADTSVEYLRYLNPELRSNVTPPEPYVVRVPGGKVNDVYAVLKRLPSSNRNTASIISASSGENWQAIANRTGVSVQELQAANAGNKAPKGKIVVPNSNKVQRTAFQRPATTPIPTAPITPSGVRVVKAQSGDTVAKLAARVGVSAVEVAKFNGLFPDSVLSAGREIKIPSR